MNDVERRMLEMFVKLSPRDVYNATFYMSTETFKMIKVSVKSLAPAIPNTAFGISIEIDENMPLGIVDLFVESDLDRWVKRQREAGNTINIATPIYSPPEVVPAPVLTLRALLRHWTRKVFKR